MKKVVWKAYMDYEKEEEWLNEMSASGLAMTEYTWCRYVFEDCDPGDYTYRIELLDNRPDHPESKLYIRFMEENGVEQVASYIRWVYFRKKAADRPFDIYSDTDSRIRHYKRILALWLPICGLDLVVGVSNLLIGLAYSPTNLAMSILLFVLGGVFLYHCFKVMQKLGRLQSEKMLRE